MSNLQRIALEYIRDNIELFHQKRLDRLKKNTLSALLKRKNPYMFRAKHVISPLDVVRTILAAQISSSEETIFGNWLEGLAIYLNDKVYKGQKSTSDAIDLDFVREKTRYIVNIKSGPNWGNSSQIEHLGKKFKSAMIRLRTSGSKATAIAVNGCCYGNKNADKGDYLIRCGQSFWELITGDNNIYLDIIEPLAHQAQEKNEEYQKEYAKIETKYVEQFIGTFCKSDRSVDWEKIVEFNAGSIKKTKKAAKKKSAKRVTQKSKP